MGTKKDNKGFGMTDSTKISALIAARMGSSRFAGKSLADLHGKPMLERMVERIRASERIGQVVLATTELAEDDPLEAWAESIGVGCFRGSADDVLGRLRSAADAFEMETIVEMLGDNPLVHSDLIDAALDVFGAGDFDYVATLTDEYPNADKALKRFPIGVRVQVFSMDTLRRCEELANSLYNREHATTFIAEHPDIFKTGFVEADGVFAELNHPKMTFAVNHRENLDLIRGIFKACFDENSNFSVGQAITAYQNDETLKSLMGEQNA